MNANYRDTFNELKPVCDILMMSPTAENLSIYIARVSDLKKELVQVFQQYLLFPLLTRMKCPEVREKMDVLIKVLDSVHLVLDRLITLNNFEMLLKLEHGLMAFLFDPKNPGMVSNEAEEVKYSAVKGLTVLMTKIPLQFRERLLKKHVPMLAQTIFVTVHIAKLEKFRALRLEALNCVMTHTMTNYQLTQEYRIPNPSLELMIVDNLLSSILPGVLAALQDVATCPDNPGHAVVASALEAIHRILCLPMHDKYLPAKSIKTEDFVKLANEKISKDITEVSSKEKHPKDMVKRSEEWFEMAGEKLLLITKSIISLRTHEHYLVRKELCVFCYRVITECGRTMAASVPLCLDVLISLSKDEHPEISYYSEIAVGHYFEIINKETKNRAIDCLMDNFMELLRTLPRILNNIDSNQKLSALNLLHGYIERLGGEDQMTPEIAQMLVSTLATAAEHDISLVKMTRVANRDVSAAAPAGSPWSVLRHVEGGRGAAALQAACRALARAAAAPLLLDLLLAALPQDQHCGLLYVMNHMMTDPDIPEDIAKRILDAYLEDEAWSGPIDVEVVETLDAGDTLDVTVYDPREWVKERVPGLYEGAVEYRYSASRGGAGGAARAAQAARRACGGAARAVRRALLLVGVGSAAGPLGNQYYSYLMRTLCPILENVGNEYEVVHLAGLKAINEISAVCGHESVGVLIQCNADYFTNHIILKLKKAWDCQAGLQILSVVMEYSDATMLDCLYGIVEDVLVQSCDKYYEKNLTSYLQVFLTFIECIRRWFPIEENIKQNDTENEIDLLHDVTEYIKHTQEAERLLSDNEFDKYLGNSAENWKTELDDKEDDLMDYDDRVTEEKPPLPLHISVTVTILKRVINFITSPHRDCAIYSLQILNRGLPILSEYEDELLPLVHSCWAPLVARFYRKEPVVLRRAFDLLVTLANLSKDFIRSRTVNCAKPGEYELTKTLLRLDIIFDREVLPEIYKYVHTSSRDSYLKDAGSAYRNSAAYTLQVRALSALPSLVLDLGLDDDRLEEAMACVDPYLSKKQPKPLQETAVKFFKTILDYDYGAAWYHLRQLCNNKLNLDVPTLKYFQLEPIEGTPYWPKDKDFENNIKMIFGIDQE